MDINGVFEYQTSIDRLMTGRMPNARRMNNSRAQMALISIELDNAIEIFAGITNKLRELALINDCETCVQPKPEQDTPCPLPAGPTNK